MHQVARVLDFYGFVHRAHEEGDVGRCPPGEQIFLEKMSVHAVSSFSDFMEAWFERHALGLFPPSQGIVRNPMFRKGAID